MPVKSWPSQPDDVSISYPASSKFVRGADLGMEESEDSTGRSTNESSALSTISSASMLLFLWVVLV
jgi:hypothetical protein